MQVPAVAAQAPLLSEEKTETSSADQNVHKYLRETLDTIKAAASAAFTEPHVMHKKFREYQILTFNQAPSEGELFCHITRMIEKDLEKVDASKKMGTMLIYYYDVILKMNEIFAKVLEIQPTFAKDLLEKTDYYPFIVTQDSLIEAFKLGSVEDREQVLALLKEPKAFLESDKDTPFENVKTYLKSLSAVMLDKFVQRFIYHLK